MLVSGRTERSKDSPVIRLSNATVAALGSRRITRRIKPFDSATSPPLAWRMTFATKGLGSMSQSPARDGEMNSRPSDRSMSALQRKTRRRSTAAPACWRDALRRLGNTPLHRRLEFENTFLAADLGARLGGQRGAEIAFAGRTGYCDDQLALILRALSDLDGSPHVGA